MRRIRQRIEALREAANDQTSEQQHGDIRIVDNVEENRVPGFLPRPFRRRRFALS